MEGCAIIDARKEIAFRDSDYKTKFTVKDGESIRIIYDDGQEAIRKCRFLDETHLNLGHTCYHIDQLMELSAKNGFRCEPISGQAVKLDVLLVQPGKPPSDIELPAKLTAIRALVGSPLEVLPLDKGHAAVVRGKSGNGVFAVFGTAVENLTSLHPYSAQMYKREFSQPERAADIMAKKPSLQAKLNKRNEAVSTAGRAAVTKSSRQHDAEI